jgi:hypothetical protein
MVSWYFQRSKFLNYLAKQNNKRMRDFQNIKEYSIIMHFCHNLWGVKNGDWENFIKNESLPDIKSMKYFIKSKKTNPIIFFTIKMEQKSFKGHIN